MTSAAARWLGASALEEPCKKQRFAKVDSRANLSTYPLSQEKLTDLWEN
jgi:hypothetical protein